MGPEPFDSRREFDTLHRRLLHTGRDRWLNGVLIDWEDAFLIAYDRVFGPVGAAHNPQILEVVADVIGAQAMGVQAMFAPILWPLKKFGGGIPTFTALVTGRPRAFMADRKIEFAQLLDASIGGVQALMRAPLQPSREVFEGLRSRVLMSPIWYPPAKRDVAELARRLELRIFARMWADGQFAPGDETASVLTRVAAIELSETYPLDYDMLSDIYNRHLHGQGQTRQARAALKRAIRPLAEELCRPAPFAYPLPPHPALYREVVASCNDQTLFGQVDADSLLQKIPYRHIDWTQVPP
jgi:hypothetical protein